MANLFARNSKRFTHAIVASTVEGHSSFTEAFQFLGFKKMSTFRALSKNWGFVSDGLSLGYKYLYRRKKSLLWV